MDGTGKRVVVTGANRGLGLQFVRLCLERGDTVWAGCRTPDAAEDLRALDAAHVLPLDVADPASIAAFGRTVGVQADGIDLLLNNAGANGTAFGADVERSGVLDLDPAHFHAQMDVNAVGPMLVTRALLPLLRSASSATIVNISSQLGSMALGARMLRDIGYNASKASLNMITTALAGTLAPDRIVVVAMHPGWVGTDMGGAEAPLTPEASARAVLDTVAKLGPKDSGTFLQWDGAKHPW